MATRRGESSPAAKAFRAFRRFVDLYPQTSKEVCDMASDVVAEAIAAVGGRAGAQKSLRAMHTKAMGGRDAQIGEFVWLYAKRARAAKDDAGRRGAADLLIKTLAEFDERYAALRDPPAVGRLVDLLTNSVLVRAKRGEHTIGHATLVIQSMAGEQGSPSSLKTRRETIDDVLRKRFG